MSRSQDLLTMMSLDSIRDEGNQTHLENNSLNSVWLMELNDGSRPLVVRTQLWLQYNDTSPIDVLLLVVHHPKWCTGRLEVRVWGWWKFITVIFSIKGK